jgi:GNAT superfamily N-acetyltransferase
VRIRRAEEGDLLALGEVFVKTAAYLTERNRPEQIGRISLDAEERLPLYRHLLATGAMWAAEDPDPVGFSAAVVRDGVWFLSQLWVLPDHHGRGIGGALLDEALAWGRGASAFTVVASPHPAAHVLYLRASMYPMYEQVEVSATEPRMAPEMPDSVASLQDPDQPWLDELDREVRGIARPEDHAFWRGEATGLALQRDGAPSGYVYVWPNGKVGPGAARDPGDVPPLIRAARNRAGGSMTFAVPSTNWTALRELVREGFAPSGSNTFMASRPLVDGSRYLSSGGGLG